MPKGKKRTKGVRVELDQPIVDAGIARPEDHFQNDPCDQWRKLPVDPDRSGKDNVEIDFEIEGPADTEQWHCSFRWRIEREAPEYQRDVCLAARH